EAVFAHRWLTRAAPMLGCRVSQGGLMARGGVIGGGMAAALLFGAVAPAAAQQQYQLQRATLTVGKNYARRSAGVVSPDSIRDNFSGALAGSTDTSFTPGPALTGFAGYHVDSFVAVEGQLGYAHWGYDRIKGKLGGAPANGKIDGDIDTVATLG